VGFSGIGTMTEDVTACRVNGVDATVVYDLPEGWSGAGSGDSGSGNSGSGDSGGGDSSGGSGGGDSGGGDSSGGSGGGDSGGGDSSGGSGGDDSGGGDSSGGSGGDDPDGQYGGGGDGGSSGESGPRFSCVGDLDLDFVVGDADLALLDASMGESGEDLAADLDANGVVDATDRLMLEALYGACPEKRVVAYFAEWGIYGRQYYPSSMPLEKITHINYAFANISADGRIAIGDPYAAIDKAYPGDTWDQPLRGNYNQFNNVLKAEHPHLKTMISVGGWTWSARFSDIALTESSRSIFAESCVEFLREYGFDGVDLDWEYPVSGGLASNVYRPEDRENYTLLLAELRAQLDAAAAEDGTEYLLTIASAAGFDKLVNFDLEGMHPHLDFINVMSYDLFGAWDLSTTGHQAGLRSSPGMTAVNPELREKYNVTWAIEEMLARGVPASKIVPGVAFYGRSWGGVSATNDGLFQSATSVPPGQWDDWSSGATGVYDWTDIEDKIASGSYTRHWDPQAKAPWLYGSAFGGHFISYDDPASVMLKGSLVQERGLGGLMFWEASGDRRETMFDAVLESLDGVPGEAP
jgi:GH18 family chitinase